MRAPAIALVVLPLLSMLRSPSAARADTLEVGSEGSASSSQMVMITGGSFTPQSVAISNGSYSFDYGSNSLHSALFEAGWAAKLFEALGTFYIQENIGYTSFQGIAQNGIGSSSGQPLSVGMIGFDTRLMHEWDWFPIKWILPFIEGGYQYTFYFQSGPSDVESAQGGVGNPVAGYGLRFWLNRGSASQPGHINLFSTFPILLTAKMNYIFPAAGTLNLASTTFMGGVTFGL